ncbi:malate synthase-domain-containing protein [Irpex rosettiformis]|uniref:Malate synthase-domain-containing protein n=1 Tax=Irpex rosettiformis TaxID=378272 RepID=A0ACB8TTF8_9APHY|nr:malate synthase-domain-containing protein [Irpex rosettiformis]
MSRASLLEKEAHLRNDIFNFFKLQFCVALLHGTTRGTVLIKTLPAAFQMEEILFGLREHSSGLNCGQWDYIFSFVKRRRAEHAAALPDRSQVTMEVPFMAAYVRLLIYCKVTAMGGMSAYIPIKDDPKANEIVTNDHDGTWIAHPLINKIAMEVFSEHMFGPNQYHIHREGMKVAVSDLLNTSIPVKITEEGIHSSVATALAYSDAGLVYVKYSSCVAGDAEYIDSIVDELVPTLVGGSVTARKLEIVAAYLKKQVRQEWPSEFLTSDLMRYLAVADGVPEKWQKSVL